MLHTMTMEYGTITGRLVAAVADTTDDPDVNPDIIPITGTVTFTPSVKAILVASEAITVVPAPITAVLDANGYVSLNGVKSVTVLATTSTYYNPNGWTYKVSFDNLAANGRRVTFDSYNIEVPVGATVDLSSVTPIPSSTGTPIVRGPKGDPGPQGIPGVATDDSTAANIASGTSTPNALTAFAGALSYRPEIPAYQVVPEKFANWRIHVARARAGQRPARLLVVGDSTSQGPTDVPHSWPTYLIDMLTASGVKARPGVIAPATDITDPRWGLIPNSGWSKAGNVGPGGGSWYATPSATASLYFSPKVAFDVLNVAYLTQPGGGSVAIDIGGTVVGTVNTAASSVGFQIATITTTGSASTAAAALHAPTGGPVNIIGIEPVTSVDTAIATVDNWAQSGTSAAGWVSSYFSLGTITARQPDLTIVMLGINDSLATTPPTADAYVANIASIVAAASATGDVMLCTSVPSNPTFQSGLGTRQSSYWAALRKYASVNRIPLFDLNARFDHYRDYNSGGWYRDQIHQSPDANYDIASAVRALVSV